MKNLIALTAGLILTLSLLTPSAQAADASANVTAGAGDAKVVSAKVLIDAPAEAVWENLTSYNEMKSYLPGYQESKVIANAGNSKTVQIGVKVHPLLPTMRYQVKINENKAAYQININKTSGDFEAIKASYKLQAIGKQTLLTYNLNITLGDKIPNVGSEKALKNSSEQCLNAIKKRSIVKYQKTMLAQAAQ